MNYTKSPILVFVSLLFLVFSQWSCNKEVVNTLTKRVDLQAIQQLEGTADAEFVGLQKIRESNNTHLTNIILTHGVREKSDSHFIDLMNAIAKNSDFDRTGTPVDLVDNSPEGIGGKGEVHIYDFVSKDKTDTLRFFHIFWSPVTAPIKQLVYDIDDNSYRTFFSDTLKKKFMVDVFGDIALYLGPFKRQMQAPVDSTLNYILRKDKGRLSPSNIVMISGSFGSKIVFDVLMRRIKVPMEMQNILTVLNDKLELLQNQSNLGLDEVENAITKLIEDKRDSIRFGAESEQYHKKGILPEYLLWELETIQNMLSGYFDEQEVIKLCSAELDNCKIHLREGRNTSLELGKQLRKIFMISNQLPFTSLTELPHDIEASRSAFISNIYQSLAGFLDQANIPSQSGPLEIISFHDPNDPFGFRIPEPPNNKFIKVINVELYNTIQWSLDPFLVDEFIRDFAGIKELPIDLNQILRQDTFRQIINFTLDEPSEQARNNQTIANHIVDGKKLNVIAPALTLVDCKKKQIAYRKIPGNYEVDSIEVETCCRTKMKNKKKEGEKNKGLVKQRKGFGYQFSRIWFGAGLLASGFRRQLRKMEIRPAQMPRRFPSKSLDNFAINNKPFEGIQKSLAENDLVSILTIHGMRSKKPEHFKILIEGLVHQLNFNPDPVLDQLTTIPPENLNSFAGHSQVRRIEYKNNAGKTLRFVVVYWSPLTFPAKDMLRELEQACDLKGKSSFIPMGVKNEIIVDGFGDVALTLKEYIPEINKNLNEAFAQLLSAPSGRNISSKNIYFISGSLGSKLLFDYLSSCLDKNLINHTHRNYRKNIGEMEYANTFKVLSRLKAFVMLTNQLSLISMKDLRPETESSMKAFQKHIFANWDELKAPALNIIAFNDPNDLLSFKLPEPASGNVSVKNIDLNVATGIEVKVFHLYKLARKLDKQLRKMSNREMRELKRYIKCQGNWKTKKKDYRRYKKPKDKLNIMIAKYILPLLDKKNPRQHFLIDIGKAHEPSDNPLIIQFLAKGPKEIPKTLDWK